MAENIRKGSGYAIGQQDFKNLREENAIYVDKTMSIEKLVTQKSRFFFLARPRRFGKSLLLSTLRYFFEGRRELFKGLFLDSTEWDWKPYPVLYLDLNTDRYAEPDKLEGVLERLFREWEERYEVNVKDTDYAQRFATIIKAAHEKTVCQVVILVDEYDKPLVSNLNKDINFELYREKLASIYSNFKSMSEHLRFVFLTGVSRFSKLSVFSDLNNLDDITFEDEFSDICGITEHELRINFPQGIKALAQMENLDFEGACCVLKNNYDGYRFTPKGSEIYNPWSLLNCLKKKKVMNFWNQTGMPNLIAEALRNTDADLERTLNVKCRLDVLAGLDLRSINPIALLYQTGYLTIKKYVPQNDTVTLGIPNREVKQGLFDVLLPYYVNAKRGTPDMLVLDIIDNIQNGDPFQLMRNLDIFLAGIPYDMKMDNENNFHNALYILLTLIGINVDTEVHTSDGRIDLVIKTEKYIYIIELKFGQDSQTALSQIEKKDYSRLYLNDSRRIFLIGANFSNSTRHIDTPIITEVGKS